MTQILNRVYHKAKLCYDQVKWSQKSAVSTLVSTVSWDGENIEDLKFEHQKKNFV